MATQVERPLRRLRGVVALTAAAALAVGLTACSSGPSEEEANTITVSYRQWGDSRIQENYLTGVKTEFEKANPGVTVQLEPVVASEDDYFTKLQLQMRSPRTSPDVVYEDTFLINSDIEAGYLRPLDEYLTGWGEWDEFTETAKGAGRALDGKTYGIPDGTDTRGLWYNEEIFAQAGLPADWQPRTWDEVLTAARTLRAAVPGVIPFNIYAGKAVGESASMQGFEMLLYGTGDTLYDDETQKWVVGSQGFTDALQFTKTVYDEGLGPSAQQVLDPNWNNTVNQQLLPQGKVAISLDGSWISQNWLETGAAPWPQWNTVLANAAWPTQQGQAPGQVSMSGGWPWAIPQTADNPDKAWQLISLLGDKDRQLKWSVDNVQIPVRDDVADDPSYLQANPTNEFFASLVPITTYRPAYAVYPRISNEIQVATETVITGGDVAAAAAAYDEQVRAIAGDAVQPAP